MDGLRGAVAGCAGRSRGCETSRVFPLSSLRQQTGHHSDGEDAGEGDGDAMVLDAVVGGYPFSEIQLAQCLKTNSSGVWLSHWTSSAGMIQYDQQAQTQAVVVAKVVVSRNVQVIADLRVCDNGPSGAFQLQVDLDTDIPSPVLLDADRTKAVPRNPARSCSRANRPGRRRLARTLGESPLADAPASS